jgi:uncharacterized protein (DUF488 family)
MTTELQTIFTIGVYGSTEESFFAALVENKIELFIDVRARRGMRGSKYSYVNSTALQTKLKDLGIYYAHLIELAPSKDIRGVQQSADKEGRTAKRQRAVLSEAYIRAYRRDVLNLYKRKPESKFNAEVVLAKARQISQYPCDQPLNRIVLFCVEQQAEACHRSLVADAWGRQQNVRIAHISG